MMLKVFHQLVLFQSTQDWFIFSDTVITHNKYSVDEITKKNNSIAHKISIIPHGNYLPFIEIKENQNESRIKLDIEKGKKVLLFFGMIKKVKGLDILLSSHWSSKEALRCSFINCG